MPEPRSRQLGSRLASGYLPGTMYYALPLLLISRDAFKRHTTQTWLHNSLKIPL